MTYTFFFLLGIPLWLIPVAYILRHQAAPLSHRTAWAAMTFLAPFLIFSLGAIGEILVQPRFARAFGYFVVLLNTLAFFYPFVSQGIYRSLYAGHPRERVG